MSAADEDTELRDLLVQTLDKNGVLGKIKAELRASIFLALEAQEQNKTQNPLKNTNLQKFVATEDGQTCIGIVNEFLDHFHLDYTTAVFGPEANVSDLTPGTVEIKNRLKLPERNEKSPLLLQVLDALKSGPSSPRGLESDQIKFLRSKFHAFDHTSSGAIDRKDVATVISHACPQMNAEIIDRFIADELKNSYLPTVTFDAFLNLFQKLYEMCSSVLAVGTQSKLPPLPRAVLPPVDQKPTGEGYYSKQSTPFHQVPASPTPMSDPGLIPPSGGSGGIPSAYLMPTDPLRHDSNMDVGYDTFFDSQLGKDAPGSRAGIVDPSYTHTDTPAISPDSSKAGNDWPNKKLKTEESSGQQYEDDFHSEHSISEDIQEDMGDDLLQSSDKDESLDLTEDRTVSEVPHADYMEDIRHG